VERLLAGGHAVLGLDNFDPFYAPEEKRGNLSEAMRSPRFRLVEVNVADAARLRAALDGEEYEAVIHLAAKAGVRPSIVDPAGYVRANVLGTQVLLAEAERRGVHRFIFASSSSVYGNASVPFREDAAAVAPVSPYAATKRAGELLCYAHQVLHGGSILCLRLFTVYGPRQRPDLAIRGFATLMAAGKPVPVFGTGASERDYTWIDDVVAAILAGLDRSARVPDEFEVVNVGGNRTTSVLRLIELLAAALGVRAVIERQPPAPGDVERTWADISKAERLLGYRPGTDIEAGITKFAEWFRSRPGRRAGA
jgi:UDP-glucuronate 4-epimerase